MSNEISVESLIIVCWYYFNPRCKSKCVMFGVYVSVYGTYTDSNSPTYTLKTTEKWLCLINEYTNYHDIIRTNYINNYAWSIDPCFGEHVKPSVLRLISPPGDRRRSDRIGLWEWGNRECTCVYAETLALKYLLGSWLISVEAAAVA